MRSHSCRSVSRGNVGWGVCCVNFVLFFTSKPLLILLLLFLVITMTSTSTTSFPQITFTLIICLRLSFCKLAPSLDIVSALSLIELIV
jgi:hypothetical protein